MPRCVHGKIILNTRNHKHWCYITCICMKLMGEDKFLLKVAVGKYGRSTGHL